MSQAADHDIDIDEWKRSSVHDEVMIAPKNNLQQQQHMGYQHMNTSVGAIAASSGVSSRSYEQSGSRSSIGGEGVKVRYISAAGNPGLYASTVSAPIPHSPAASIGLSPEVPVALSPHQHVVALGSSHNPLHHGSVVIGGGTGLGTVGLGASLVAHPNSADESANRMGVSTTGVAGSTSALAVAGGSGSYLAAGGVSGVAVAGGSGSHIAHGLANLGGVNHHIYPSYQTVSSSNVRTITIHPASSSHALTEPSASSSGPGSTNDYYPVFVAPTGAGGLGMVGGGDGAGGIGEQRSSNSTTDHSSSVGVAGFAQQPHTYAPQGTGGGHPQRHHAVLLPDGSLLAPHLACHQSAPHPHHQGVMGLPSLHQQQMLSNEEAQLGANSVARGSVLGVGGGNNSSTTTNAAVWGGSTSRQQLQMTNSTSIPIGAALQRQSGQLGVQGYVAGGPAYPSPNTNSQPPTYPSVPVGTITNKSQFIGGRGRGGAPQQTAPSTIQNAPVQYPQQSAGPRGGGVNGVTPPMLAVPGATMPPGRGAPLGLGRPGGRGGGIVIGTRPVAVQTSTPVLGNAPSILIGKLPTPTFTQTISVGGMKLGTSKLVAPRFPGQAEEVLKVSPTTPSDTPTPSTSTEASSGA